MTIFQLTRQSRIALTALYLQTRPRYPHHESDVADKAAAVMTREQLVAAIVATPRGRRMVKG